MESVRNTNSKRESVCAIFFFQRFLEHFTRRAIAFLFLFPPTLLMALLVLFVNAKRPLCWQSFFFFKRRVPILSERSGIAAFRILVVTDHFVFTQLHLFPKRRRKCTAHASVIFCYSSLVPILMMYVYIRIYIYV